MPGNPVLFTADDLRVLRRVVRAERSGRRSGDHRRRNPRLYGPAKGFWARLTSEASGGGGYYSWKRLKDDAETDGSPAETGTDDAKEAHGTEGLKVGATDGMVVWLERDTTDDPAERRFTCGGAIGEPGTPGTSHFYSRTVHYKGTGVPAEETVNWWTVPAVAGSFFRARFIARGCLLGEAPEHPKVLTAAYSVMGLDGGDLWNDFHLLVGSNGNSWSSHEVLLLGPVPGNTAALYFEYRCPASGDLNFRFRYRGDEQADWPETPTSMEFVLTAIVEVFTPPTVPGDEVGNGW